MGRKVRAWKMGVRSYRDWPTTSGGGGYSRRKTRPETRPCEPCAGLGLVRRNKDGSMRPADRGVLDRLLSRFCHPCGGTGRVALDAQGGE